VRLFIAINLPQEIRSDLWQAAAPLRAASYPIRWVAADSIHLTLKFLGEAGPEREAEIIAGVERSVEGTRTFALPIGEFGAFPSPSRARVVWAGCEGVPPLELLQDRLEREMEGLGFPIEGRAFHPHLTLGRVKRHAKAGDLSGLDEQLEQLEYGAEFDVKSVDVMQSTLSRSGARYEVRRAVEFEV
jgi:2'-5' RNA ligase